jgi:hypothetical protein
MIVGCVVTFRRHRQARRVARRNRGCLFLVGLGMAACAYPVIVRATPLGIA